MPGRGRLLLAGSAFTLGAGVGARALGRRASPPPPPPEPAPEPPGPTPREIVQEALVDALVARPEARHPDDSQPATDAIYARLTDDDQRAIVAALEGNAKELWEGADEGMRRRLSLSFAAFYGLAEPLEHMGLSAATPPEDVHAMSRGPVAAGGDPGIADLVLRRLAEAGLEPPEGGTILDFGCSSGRVLRTIAAARQDLRCLGCDPNGPAIAWAQQNLPRAEFFESPTAPPLDLDAASVDTAYAISIWSHFDAEQALTWLDEMRRILKPGGALLLTTHGFDALASFLRPDNMTHESAAEAVLSLITNGHHWFDVFGEEGDWGVKAAGWGNAFLSLEWLLRNATPAWSARLMVPGALDGNQDVIVLERR